MSDAPYPLHALRALRAAEVEEARRTLMGVERECETAEKNAEACTTARQLHEQATLASLSVPQSAADAMTLNAWRARRREEANALREREEESWRQARLLKQRVQSAGAALSASLAAEKAVAIHHERWEEAERQGAEQRLEDEMLRRR